LYYFLIWLIEEEEGKVEVVDKKERGRIWLGGNGGGAWQFGVWFLVIGKLIRRHKTKQDVSLFLPFHELELPLLCLALPCLLDLEGWMDGWMDGLVDG
jgi:hypothetical protein